MKHKMKQRETFQDTMRKLLKMYFTDEEIARMKNMTKREYKTFIQEKQKEEKIQKLLNTSDEILFQEINFDIGEDK